MKTRLMIMTIAAIFCGMLNAQNYSTLTDSRDGQSYKTVQIGTQWWMAQNLNYGTYEALPLSGAQPSKHKYCQTLAGKEDSTCAMGGLYEWTNLMQGDSGCNGTGSSQPACTSPAQGLCPSGWHVPSHYEWTLLEQTVGTPQEGSSVFPYDSTTISLILSWPGTNEGNNLKQTGTLNWHSPNTGATNSSGFTALPGGGSYAGHFTNAGIGGYFWSSSTGSSGTWMRGVKYNSTGVERELIYRTSGYSCRCVQNNTTTGIQDQDPPKDRSFKAYIADNTFRFESPKQTLIALYDIRGSLLYSGDVNTAEVHVIPGIYVLRTTEGNVKLINR